MILSKKKCQTYRVHYPKNPIVLIRQKILFFCLFFLKTLIPHNLKTRSRVSLNVYLMLGLPQESSLARGPHKILLFRIGYFFKSKSQSIAIYPDIYSGKISM